MAVKIELFFYGKTKALETELKKDGFACAPATGRPGAVASKTVAEAEVDAVVDAAKRAAVKHGVDYDGCGTSTVAEN